MTEEYDVVVIGSGFGGAITGGRLAQAGHSVCVLERGQEWGRKDFPRTTGQVARAFWDEQDFGLLDYRSFKKIDVIQGSGVGGGSLVYFNVHIRTPPEIFEHPRWPKNVTRAGLDPFYDMAKEMLEAKPLKPPEELVMPNRTEAFFAAAEGAGKRAELVDICVYTGPERRNRHGALQGPCVYCGNCMLGCHVHAKNTLDLNYLKLVGASQESVIKPLHQAEYIEPVEGLGYRVHFKRYLYDRSQRRAPGEPKRPAEFVRGTVVGRRVIVSAGSLGSTEILLRSRDKYKTLPKLSPALGHNFSGNGDFLLAGTFKADREVDPGSGPDITAITDWSTAKNRIHIEDLGFPDPLLWFLEGSLPTPTRLWNLKLALRKYLYRALGLSRASAFTDGAQKLFQGGVTPRFLPYLGMGTDAADGRMRLSGGNIDVEWNNSASREMFAEMEEALKKLSAGIGGKYASSILWKWPLRKLLTAHPLGGCVMADDPARGVVNEFGEVYGYPGLYVADGSVIPTALSVNPSATISAISERIADRMINA